MLSENNLKIIVATLKQGCTALFPFFSLHEITVLVRAGQALNFLEGAVSGGFEGAIGGIGDDRFL